MFISVRQHEYEITLVCIENRMKIILLNYSTGPYYSQVLLRIPVFNIQDGSGLYLNELSIPLGLEALKAI